MRWMGRRTEDWTGCREGRGWAGARCGQSERSESGDEAQRRIVKEKVGDWSERSIRKRGG